MHLKLARVSAVTFDFLITLIDTRGDTNPDLLFSCPVLRVPFLTYFLISLSFFSTAIVTTRFSFVLQKHNKFLV